jgi:tRNA modification GTPase
MLRGDTIAAISSSVGPAARIILRVSGAQSRDIANTVGVPQDLPASSASRQDISFGGFTFAAWIYVFHAPRSYTGEDLIELHIPGNPLLASRLLDHLLKHGARAAEPGEFTARAFFNGRMDLSTAEGVAAVIGAGNDQELQAGRQLMAGELARRLAPIMTSLKQTLALIEVGIDFSQEDVTILASEEQAARIAQVDTDLHSLLSESSRFTRLSHEPRVVLVGRPNAGKSTLLNTLAGHDRAVVSPIAGTTRDVLSARVALPSGYIHLTDVAGIQQINADDSIENQMQSQARRAVAEADFIVLVQDATDLSRSIELDREPNLVVRTKLDLTLLFPPPVLGGRDREGVCCERADASNAIEPPPQPSPGVPEEGEVSVSAKTGTGMDDLITTLNARCFGTASTNTGLALNVRHVQAIEAACSALARTTHATDGELIAADLREVLDALGSILGHVSTDDLLGVIFSGFCIGK